MEHMFNIKTVWNKWKWEIDRPYYHAKNQLMVAQYYIPTLDTTCAWLATLYVGPMTLRMLNSAQ